MGNRKLDIETRLSRSGTCLGSPSAEGGGGAACSWHGAWKPWATRPMCLRARSDHCFFLSNMYCFHLNAGSNSIGKKYLKSQKLTLFEHPRSPSCSGTVCSPTCRGRWRLGLSFEEDDSGESGNKGEARKDRRTDVWDLAQPSPHPSRRFLSP